jgi:hypothetical protein
MALPIPELDTIEFEQLAEEARALIPRYAPDWTDHNLHDPGITILELLAWIIDQQIYQIGFVSDRHLQAFAALLGVRPKAAIPARGLVWPKMLQDRPVILAEAELSRGDKLHCLQQPDLSFVLDADVHLSPADVANQGVVAKLENRAVNLTGFMRRPCSSFLLQPETSGEKMLELAFDQPLVRVGEKPIALGIEVDAIAPSAHSEVPTPWGPLIIEYWTDASSWRRVAIVEDGTFSLTRTGVVLIKIPADAQAESSKLRLRLDQGYFPFPIQIVRMEINVLPVVQLEERPAKAIGRSNALPNQTFALELNGLPDQRLSFSPMGIKTFESDSSESSNPIRFPNPLRIEITEGADLKEWTQTHDLSCAKPSETVYRLDTSADKIQFGNGINGKIPQYDAQIQNKSYHTTRGADGNLAQGLDWRLDKAQVAGNIFGSNPEPIRGGENAWDIERLLAEVRTQVLNRQVLLTDRDLLSKVESLPGFGVARADVLPRYHPSLPDQDLRNARTLLVIPWRNKGEISIPEVQARYLKEIEAAIKPYRVLGERLTVIAHQRVPIQIEARLLVDAGRDAEKIRKEAVKRLKARLSDIAAERANDRGWPLGRPVTVGEIQALLSSILEVVAVAGCKLARNGNPLTDQDVLLGRDEVAVGFEDDFTVTVDFVEGR